MVRREIVIFRIDKLKEYLRYLEDVKKYSREEYIKNPLIYGSSERFLHLTIECVMDIANHLISDLRFRKPESNRDVFDILYENDIIDRKLKESLCNMASFRNILVHDYLKLDREIVYDIILNNLGDIVSFLNIIKDYI
ncbi:hypothetical protein U732_2710 [Clostridium argentinense CDC 2741]|uniref:DUF86 domain-containing protein n=1 Tax=Clostridium argentinense CDC 2741 TaxID=1418104 RepID=A0A0C1U258_9CLOT|nr:DUF86 domain-containing protein [Clostridium argentinense]ARC86737.1 hypothetical protein RSJ17_20700 [Clostridium argentinense]KIE45613.1 hypothetical protein U732_2710 [Clostridium argentinense CDC 2741]NFF38482.1 DUF86 domain-containing protein [Clostridium argentinense]NFP49325.1 DUF86 domain-containing protein [Clostridium argentinense]NFP71728.1 DUF86 domain-containing protein [Clostridium argentinense]